MWNRIILHFNHICLSKVRSVLILNSLLNPFSILSKALCNRLSLLLAQLHTSAYYYFIYICVYTFIQIVRLLNEICVCVCLIGFDDLCFFLLSWYKWNLIYRKKKEWIEKVMNDCITEFQAHVEDAVIYSATSFFIKLLEKEDMVSYRLKITCCLIWLMVYWWQRVIFHRIFEEMFIDLFTLLAISICQIVLVIVYHGQCPASPFFIHDIDYWGYNSGHFEYNCFINSSFWWFKSMECFINIV